MKKKLGLGAIILVLFLCGGFFWKQQMPLTDVLGHAYQMTLDGSDQLYLIFSKDKSSHQVVLTSFKDNVKTLTHKKQFTQAYKAQAMSGKNLVYQIKKKTLTLSWSQNAQSSGDALILGNLKKQDGDTLEGSIKASGDGNFAIFTEFNMVTLKRLD